MDKKQMEFSVFCIESIAEKLGQTGDVIYEMLTKESSILNDYIVSSFSRGTLDFGKGFYTTPIKGQAKKWSKRFIGTKGQGILSAFEFDENSMPSMNCLTFESYSEEWLEFNKEQAVIDKCLRFVSSEEVE
ncbi:MAG: DUF3990 domain-containing protein [Fibromonadaceae bacterium]|jgi:hypothetical protein|nr:DUF3990 domain-containing protein [Fibromonadaceae bacterium]